MWEIYEDYAEASWFKLGFRMETAACTNCPFHEPLWMSHAGDLGTDCVSKAANAIENWRWTQIPSEKQWQTWQKGKIWHTLVSTGEKAALWRNTHWETSATIWNTTQTYDTVALHCRHLQLGDISHHWLYFSFLFFFFFYLPASHVTLSKSLLFLLVSPPLPLPTSALTRSPQLDRKQTQKWIFNWIVRKLTVLINPLQ